MAPALSIKLDQEKKIWYAGDVVSGQVTLQNKEKVDITKDVILVFECLAKLGVNSRYPNNPPITGYRTTKKYLFEWQDCLCQGPTTLPPGDTSWKFSLPIPRNYKETMSRSEGDDLPFVTEPAGGPEQEMLPPSMNESAVAGECIVTYILIASVRSEKFFTKDKSTTLRLVVHPQTQSQSTELSPASQTFQVKSRSSNTSLKEKMRFAMKPSAQPSSEFKLVMELPSYVVHSVNHRGRLSVEHVPQETTGTEPPIVNLTWIDVTMTQQTSVAVSRHPWTTGKPVASWNGKVQLNKTVELETLMRRIAIPESTIPTFNTSLATVNWQWHFHVIFNCGGKDLDFRGDIPFTVLSQRWDGTANGSNIPTVEGNLMDTSGKN